MDLTNNYQVIVLQEGYSKFEANIQLANCSCTLIKGPLNIIVDTMTAWDGNKLKTALEQNSLNCDNINYVICTHGHSDHIGCNYLFQKAIHIVGFSISKENKYFEHDFQNGQSYTIDEKVKVIPTPGHTLQDVSVIVETHDKGIVAITGDLFENEHDLNDDTIWKSAGSDNEELQVINRQRILSLADYIVPGHGQMFKVNKCDD